MLKKKKKKATANVEHVMLSVIEEQLHILSLAAPLALTLHPPDPGDRSFYDRIGLSDPDTGLIIEASTWRE